MSIRKMKRLESDFVRASMTAPARGRASAFRAGLTVLQAEGGELIALSPDGTRRVVKQLPPAVKVARRVFRIG
ncbi:MAG: hypothetical protein ACRCT8_06465 [Lacipirellulaceae bacterium]